jgi:nitronate monooxygenase
VFSLLPIRMGFLRCPAAQIYPAWAEALARTAPKQTLVSRVFSGRAGRSIANANALAATAVGAPTPAPYPVQRGLTAATWAAALKEGNIRRMQPWAGPSAALAEATPATEVLHRAWDGAKTLLGPLSPPP